MLSRKGGDKALSLSLQAYSIAKATNPADSDAKTSVEDMPPTAVVRDTEHDGVKFKLPDVKEEKEEEEAVSISPSRQDFDAARSKSSPSSPVGTPLSLPGMVRVHIPSHSRDV